MVGIEWTDSNDMTYVSDDVVNAVGRLRRIMMTWYDDVMR